MTGFGRSVLTAGLAVWFVSPAVPQLANTETGLASWYGYPYHGHFAASGEIYNMDELTAAHPTLPFNTRVRVVNLSNDRSVEVRITDRGPFVDGRIIDLSRAAAHSIGLIEAGTAVVRLEVLGMLEAVAYASLPRPALSLAPRAPAPPAWVTKAPPPPSPPRAQVAALPSPAGLFSVQTGAFRSRDNAQRYAVLMQARYGSARMVHGDADLWRVLVGPDTNWDGAVALAERIRTDSGENNAFAVQLDDSHEPEQPGQFPRPRGAVAADGLHTPLD